MSSDADDHKLARESRDAVAVGIARRALTLWDSFPIDEPRPIVLMHGPVELCQGFNNADAYSAMRYGLIVADETVAPEPMQTIRTYSSDQSNQRVPKTPLRILSAVLTETVFSTDRGPTRLPAWKIEAVDAIGPIWVVASETIAQCWFGHLARDWYQQGPHILTSATFRNEDSELVVRFIGGSENFFEYEGVAVESRTAISAVPLARLKRSLMPGTAIAAQGFEREIVVRLESPLGGRVLVNHDGAPVEVVNS